MGGSHCSEPQSGERPDLREAGHAHLKAGVFLPRLKGPIDRSWELKPPRLGLAYIPWAPESPKKGGGNEAADSRPQPRNLDLAGLQRA